MCENVYYVKNDVCKHDKQKHLKGEPETVKKLKLFNCSQVITYDLNELIEEETDKKFNRCIYLISYLCHVYVIGTYNIFDELCKENVSFFYLA